jgi:hypothetical protein
VTPANNPSFPDMKSYISLDLTDLSTIVDKKTTLWGTALHNQRAVGFQEGPYATLPNQISTDVITIYLGS